MNANQILATSEMILENYGYLKIDDFKLCFSWAKRGFFGQVYRIDGNVILSWIEQYADERAKTGSEMNFAQHESLKMDEKRTYNFAELIQNRLKT